MLTEIFGNLNDLFIDHGYWGLFIACMGLFPAEPLMAVLGTMDQYSVLQIGLISALGEMVGAYFTYAVGLLLKEETLLRNIRRNGLFLNITEEGYLQSKKDVMKKGSLFVLISRFIPWLRIVVAVAAGFLRFNIFTFSIAVFLGTFGYAYIIGWLGSRFPEAWDTIYLFIDKFNDILLLVIIGLIAYKVWDIYKKAKQPLKNE